MRASTLESPLRASLARRMLSAIRSQTRIGGRKKAERDSQAEHIDVESGRMVDQEVGIVGPEAPQLREPPRLEEAARLGIDHSRAARTATRDDLEIPSFQIRSATATQRSADPLTPS